MDERIGLRIAFDGHQVGETPATAAVAAGWRSIVITPPHQAAAVDAAAVRSLRSLTGEGVRLVWDGRGTGSWVDVGRARLRALERAREQVRRAAEVGAAVVVVGCDDGCADQPVDARWDQMAAGVSELSYEAEREGVQLALETKPITATVDLAVEDRLVVDHGRASGVRLALDHSGWLSGQAVPEAWWPAVAWIRLHAPEPDVWDQVAEVATADARRAAETFSAAVVEMALWGWEYRTLPLPLHDRQVGTDA